MQSIGAHLTGKISTKYLRQHSEKLEMRIQINIVSPDDEARIDLRNNFLTKSKSFENQALNQVLQISNRFYFHILASNQKSRTYILIDLPSLSSG